MNKTMASAQYASLALGITLVDIQNVLSILLMVISIIVGVINLLVIIKKAFEDGEIDETEEKQITEAVKDIKDKVEDISEKFTDENKH